MDERLIFLVEDNRDEEELMMLAMERHNVPNQVVVARDGHEALKMLHGEGEKGEGRMKTLPTLILLDLSIPKVNGLEVLKRIRAHQLTRFLPVVVMSSTGGEDEIAACYDNGCNSFVRKPLDFNDFQEALKYIVDYWLRCNSFPPST